jgi:hypothetical protein
MSDGLEHDLRCAWHYRDRSLVRFVLMCSSRIESSPVRAKRAEWIRRLRYYWPVWRAAAALWDAMPESLRPRRQRWTPQQALVS